MTKYDFDFPIEDIQINVRRLTNQLWKLIPMREHNEDWPKQLNTVILEIAGLNEIFKSPQFLQLLSKLEGLQQSEEIEFDLQPISDALVAERIYSVNNVKAKDTVTVSGVKAKDTVTFYSEDAVDADGKLEENVKALQIQKVSKSGAVTVTFKDALASIPIEPVTILASSDKMSPNIFSVKITSNCAGSFTSCIAQLSTSICSKVTSG